MQIRQPKAIQGVLGETASISKYITVNREPTVLGYRLGELTVSANTGKL
jgi:hypothetical protein